MAALPFAACFAEPHSAKETGDAAAATGGSDATGGTGQGGTSGRTTGSKGGRNTGGGGHAGSQFGQPPGGGIDGTDGSIGASGEGGEQGGHTVSFCNPVTATPLPPRPAIIDANAPDPSSGPQVITLTKASLYRDFQQATCGSDGCHGGVGDPLAEQFHLTLDTFDQRPTLGEDALSRILSSDPNKVMPPDTPGGDGSKRTEADPTRQLGERLLAWQKKGFPASFDYELAPSGPTQNVGNPYAVSKTLARTLTNIGSCVPDMAVMLDPAMDEMQQKDAAFAGMETTDDLPDTLFETDLVSLESGELSKRHVFSYAPTYPLYSDSAGKMRHVRVPLGQSIHYDATLRDFVIPDNTRFYKTFLKQVTDKDGNVGWRKMETRLIVVRQDTQLADGSYQTHALRASYAWNKDESMAHRVKDPLRNTQPAADRLCPVIVDESVTRDPSENPISDLASDTCEYMTSDEIKHADSGQVRHYAIPSTQRCDQCHMGSSSHSFILGFTPWQVDRRKSGEGGVYEDPSNDELSQLQRFLDYGIVKGIEPGQVKLEESQLIANPPRSPRNDYELKAQGYMLGNCAFCHNPHGYPVVQNPILKEFELFPSETGGIFQFPLEKYSPRAKAGPAQNYQLPYITAAFGALQIDNGSPLPPDATKIYSEGDPPFLKKPQGAPDMIYPDPQTQEFTLLGPWRSLIWRNVSTPFTYTDNGTIFIHMPRNASGFDCRAKNIMADWMLSIPVVTTAAAPDTSSQPVTEVVDSPTNAYAIAQAKLDAKRRLDAYHGSVTGSSCPPDDDIVDPKVILSPLDQTTGHKVRPAPQDDGVSSPLLNDIYDYSTALLDRVPDHANWVPTDTTDNPGKWVPRRPNWRDYLVTRTQHISDTVDKVVDDLQDVHVTQELHDFALTAEPMGLWVPSCAAAVTDGSPVPLVNDLMKDQSQPFRRWLGGGVIKGDGGQNNTAVHFQSPGEAVFHAICQNCHGKAADSNSPLAATISELTGGQTRVANFIDGLFGPASAPGAYAHDEFLVDGGATPLDWQARYVLFMGLGGTGASIPLSVLALVATAPFYGVPVTAPGATTPNMLASAQQFCSGVLTAARVLPLDGQTPRRPAVDSTSYAKNTAHLELWEALCGFQNQPVVHVFTPNAPGATPASSSPTSDATHLYRATDDAGNSIYPDDALVGNQFGLFDYGISSSNLTPWCISGQSDQERQYGIAWGAQVGLTAAQVPFCPPSLFTTALGLQVYHLAMDLSTKAPIPDAPLGNQDFAEKWVRHGAMTAGLSAFEYLSGFTSGTVKPSLSYDFCTQPGYVSAGSGPTGASGAAGE